MQITKITFIGTSAEYASVRHLFEEPAAAPSSSADDGRSRQTIEQPSYEDILRVLRHSTLLPRHQQLLKVLHDEESYLSRSELATRLQVSPEQLNGILGSLARYIRRIPDLHGSTAQTAPLRVLLDVTYDNGEWQYRLHPDTRKALEAEGLI